MSEPYFDENISDFDVLPFSLTAEDIEWFMNLEVAE